MKKILTLVFCLGILTSVFSQSNQQRGYDGRNDNGYENRNYSGRNNGYDNRNNGRRYDDAYKFSVRERDELVARIDREYSDKIESVRRRWFMNPHDKRRLISSLEYEKSAKISSIYARFADSRNRFYDGYSYNNNHRQ